MKQPPIVAASVLSADFARLGEEAQNALAAGAERLHLDIMDNLYVPNLTFGPPVCAALRKLLPNADLDAHLMTQNPDNLVLPFAKAGANGLAFHPDAAQHPHRTAETIAANGMRPGIALNPHQTPDGLEYLLGAAEAVIVMTVNPGFGGQTFIPQMLDKIRAVRKIIDNSGKPVRLQVDGGVNEQTAKLCLEAGADTLVAGNYIFGGGNYAEAVNALRPK